MRLPGRGVQQHHGADLSSPCPAALLQAPAGPPDGSPVRGAVTGARGGRCPGDTRKHRPRGGGRRGLTRDPVPVLQASRRPEITGTDRLDSKRAPYRRPTSAHARNRKTFPAGEGVSYKMYGKLFSKKPRHKPAPTGLSTMRCGYPLDVWLAGRRRPVARRACMELLTDCGRRPARRGR